MSYVDDSDEKKLKAKDLIFFSPETKQIIAKVKKKN
jgi:hypothetical protein